MFLSLSAFALQPTLCVAASQPVLTLCIHPEVLETLFAFTTRHLHKDSYKQFCFSKDPCLMVEPVAAMILCIGKA